MPIRASMEIEGNDYNDGAIAENPAGFDADIDKDGVVSEKEFKFLERRLNTTRKLAISSFIVLTAAAGYILTAMPPDRLEALNGATDVIFIVLGGVVATYMGAEAFVTRRRNRADY